MDIQLTIPPSYPENQLLSVAGGHYRMMVSGKQTNSAYAAIDMLIPPGGGPNPHAHPHFQESFYVLEGAIEVKTEKETYTADKGSLVTIPAGGIIHCFKNKSDTVAHLLCVVVPAGLEEFFVAVGQPAEEGIFLKVQPPDPAALQLIKTLAEKYGQILYPPDYFG